MQSHSRSKLPADVLDSYIESKIRYRDFETYKHLFTPDHTTNDWEYIKMRRSIKPLA